MHNLLRTALLLVCVVAAQAATELRLGIIGTDSSHCLQFAKLLHDPTNPQHVPGARIVAAFKGGSPDIPQSGSRVDAYAAELERDYGVRLCATIAEVARESDAIMLLSADGRKHLAQAMELFPFGKPMFVDKPAAASLADAVELFRLAAASGVKIFSASALRFGPQMEKLRDAKIGDLKGAFAYGPAPIEPHHPDLFWYGVHSVEALYAFMGPGCVSVSRTHTADADIVTGVWADGRTGTVRGIRNASGAYGLLLFGTKAVAVRDSGHGYAPLLSKIVEFFRTGVVPVPPAETLETLAFMEAADESKRREGRPVALETLPAVQR